MSSKTDHPSFAINRRLNTSKPHHTTQRIIPTHLIITFLQTTAKFKRVSCRFLPQRRPTHLLIPRHRLIKLRIYPRQDISTLQSARITHRKGPWKLRSTIPSHSIKMHMREKRPSGWLSSISLSTRDVKSGATVRECTVIVRIDTDVP
jgi:hypothetical protein